MALILEVLDAEGRPTRHQLDGVPLTLGRALSNDVILDDPYVDARHARLLVDDSGAIVVEDLGSVNGLVAGQKRRFGRTVVQLGEELRMGRTTIRVRDPNEFVSPALVDQPPTPAVRRPRRLIRVFQTTAGQLAVAAVSIAAFALYTWIGTPTRSTASEVSGSAVGFAAMFCAWAGLWSIASRIIVHRFNFVGHLAIVSAVSLAVTCFDIVNEWLQFLFPDARLVTVFQYPIFFVVLVAFITGHIMLTSTMSRRRQWRIGAIVATTVFAIGGLAALTKDDSFSDVPTFSAVVKPMAPRWVPTKSIDQFDDVARQLEKQVDVLAAKK